MYKFNSHLIWLMLVLLFMGQANCALPTAVNGEPLPSLAPMLKNVVPAVVNISSAQTQVINNPLFNDPFFRHFFNLPEQKQKKQSRGSGVIIDAQVGYVITNNHVIEEADEISVILHDGREFEAKLIGTDPETDIALLKINPENLTALSFANSDRLEVGDFVVAIGNPFGLGQTVTSGIVSALGRSGLGIEGYEDFIQTDASINPGNSGGALVNLEGKLIGINTAIIAPGGGNVGIGFAIPINMADQVVQHLKDYGEVKRGQLGISIQDLTPDLATAFGMGPKKGAVIAEVVPGSAAEKAGLRVSDIITDINNKSVNSATDVRNRIGLLRIGERVKITLLRKGRTRNIYAVIADIQGFEGREVSGYLDGAVLKDSVDGIQVEQITQGSNADQMGLLPGDIIIGFNRREVKTIEDLRQRFTYYRLRSIQIKRDGDIFSIRLN
jgi:serine protease DegQ